jgi:TPP-dependent indolepyruvate ferredoxin oxidoreductase alpha subunit
MEKWVLKWFDSEPIDSQLGFFTKITNILNKRLENFKNLRENQILRKDPRSHIGVIVNGQTFKNLKSAANHFQLDYEILKSRHRRGLPVNEIFQEVIEEKA